MFYLIKTIRKLLQALASQAGIWQISAGTAIGMMLGFLVVWPWGDAPAPIGFSLLLLGLIINVHLGGLLLFWGLGGLLSLALSPMAVAIGNGMPATAAAAADNPLLFASYISHTGYLGLALLGVVFAALTALVMAVFTRYFRTRIQPKLVARKRLVQSGKIGSNPILVRILCWFFAV
jgi:hypothetical protein